ncbi:MAG: hypothetical protein ABF532_09670 [Bifidobacterium sp.]|jgi:hypothetical protein|uniref:hypothetical protein n=1 Tax=Bifidobacterium sp. TaxID=41200 RepID=UPI0039E94EB8
MTRITLRTDIDSIPLRDDYTWKHHAWAIKKDGIKGLLGTPGMKESTTSRPQQDGDYWPSRITQKPRSASLDCIIRGASSVEAAAARDRVNNLFGREITIIEETAAGRRYLTGMLASDPEPLMRWREQGFEFGLVITIPDPLKYGDPIVYTASNGLIRCENTGTAPTWPTLAVNGRCLALTVSLAWQKVVWQGDATSLAIDFRDVIPSSGKITYDDAFPIPPGTSAVAVQATAGAQVSLSVRPAWR